MKNEMRFFTVKLTFPLKVMQHQKQKLMHSLLTLNGCANTFHIHLL